METLLDRMLRAAKLDESVYWELRRDPRAPYQAGVVILIIALVSALAAIPFGAVLSGFLAPTVIGYVATLALVGTLIWWLALSAVYYVVATRFLGSWGSFPNVVYAIAFALVPSVLQIFLAFLPARVDQIGFLIIGIWLFLTQSTAVRQTLGIPPMYAFIMVFATTFLLRIVLSMLLPRELSGFLRVF